MNRKQAIYKAAHAFDKKQPIVMATLGLPSIVYGVSQLFGNNMLGGGALFLVAALAIREGHAGLRSSYINQEDIEKINLNPQEFPLDHSERIIFEDTDGLDALLERTNAKKWEEWVTFLKSYPDKDGAVVTEIIDVEQARQEGLIKEPKTGVEGYTTPAIEEGYNGMHHYHPNFLILPGEIHYSISQTDRCLPENWMNLLTFNTSKGPEVIGYNKQFTYLPKDETKRELVRATHEDILKYLA